MTRSRVSAAIGTRVGASFKTRGTVLCETPAACAISRMVVTGDAMGARLSLAMHAYDVISRYRVVRRRPAPRPVVGGVGGHRGAQWPPVGDARGRARVARGTGGARRPRRLTRDRSPRDRGPREPPRRDRTPARRGARGDRRPLL